MTLEIRTTGDPNCFDLYDDVTDERIGEIVNPPDDWSDAPADSPPYWTAEIWSQMGTGKTWTGESESFDEIKQHALEMYEEFAAERRELSKGSRTWTTGSVPMGGKPGWRRR
ncbi:hypothetical protein [Streptomyces sp. NPDC008137]|uniref:hypothetical protein n=1 Tax=Streptomyces sp. NPDC008137 TaxID=3364813 RepID=UPI0036E66B9E